MKIKLRIFFIIIVLYCLSACKLVSRQNQSLPMQNSLIRVLSPEESMKEMQLESGFSIKIVASEPLINSPVAIAFDDCDRIWVVEMSDYQPIQGKSAPPPLGKIVILQDTNHDGKMDLAKVFMDSLRMPRAICLAYGGVLIASPPDLWFIRIGKNDRPGKRTLIDSEYTISDNVEGQTNGLMRSMDNWIYSVGFGSSKRYREINGHWIIQKTFIRGQWGITQDNYGHLFYNRNEENLLGDYFLPGVTSGNEFLKKVSGINQVIVSDNRVYPAGPTPGVNRGYLKGILDINKRLIDFTAGCGPCIYRGGIFPKEYAENAFVCGPAGNLIKRNILQYGPGLKITGKQAYIGKEFLASRDKRFRPVNLFNGPDGALYIVDLYRGVIQDSLSLTDYLKKYSLSHGLINPINCGRIYKIFPTGTELTPIIIPNDPNKLVTLLSNKNGWVRDMAQQKIVDNQYKQVVPQLRNILSSTKIGPISQIQAFWTLEGLSELRATDVIGFLNSDNQRLQIQALTALIGLLNKSNLTTFLPLINEELSKSDPVLDSYITYVADKIFNLSPQIAIKLWEQIVNKYPNNEYITDAIISGIQGKEGMFKNMFPGDLSFHTTLNDVIKNKERILKGTNLMSLKNKYPEGYAIFTGTCQTCHGSDGNGIEFTAPPLNGSNWVNGDKSKLIPIVLYGLTGPITVNNKIYKKPEVLGAMPGFGNNKFSDRDLAEILSFIRQAWENNSNSVSINDIEKIRIKYKGRETSFTMKELDLDYHGK